jgi:DNA-binding winged helix-turn-helix (wHTH) protein
LYAGVEPMPVPERLFQILLALVQAGGNVVGRDDLANSVWGSEGVTDTNLNQHIYLLRHLLGERNGERSYVLTIPGEGYRLAASVSVAPEDEEQFVEDAVRLAERALDVSNDLFQLYCKGSYLLDRRTAPSLAGAAQAFEAALRVDPKYVPALIGLARAHALLAEYCHVAPAPAFTKAKDAISRALADEPRSSMAHAVLSEIQLFYDWDWVRAKRSLDTAIAINPQSTFARNNAAWYYICSAELHKAQLEAKRALIVEPASLPLQLLQARVLIHAGDFEAALTALSNILAIDPKYDLARRIRALDYIFLERGSDALDDLAATEVDAVDDLSFRLPLVACAQVFSDVRKANETYEQLQSRAGREYVAHRNLAMVAAALNRSEDALRHLNDALRDREPSLLLIRTLPWFRALELRSEFKKILRQIGPERGFGRLDRAFQLEQRTFQR